jgi:hypothetical protein
MLAAPAIRRTARLALANVAFAAASSVLGANNAAANETSGASPEAPNCQSESAEIVATHRSFGKADRRRFDGADLPNDPPGTGREERLISAPNLLRTDTPTSSFDAPESAEK